MSARLGGSWIWCVLILAAAFRFYGIRWDEGAMQHPDERHVLMAAGNLAWPQSVGEYLDERASPLNPRNRGTGYFAYGTLPTTLLRAMAEWGGIRRPEHLLVAGRALAALADLVALLALAAMTQVLWRDRRVTLLTSLLYAACVLPIQHAHFFVSDPFASALVAVALWRLAAAWRSGRLLDWAITGLALGLALACKVSVATFALPAGLVALRPAAGGPARGWARALGIGALRGVIFGAAAFVAVRLAMPDAFVGWFGIAPRWWANIREVIEVSTGVRDIVFTRQFAGRWLLAWPWWNMVVWGMGGALGLAAWAGWLRGAWEILRRRAWAFLIPVSWVATVFFHQGTVYQHTLRYFLPAYGCLIALGAWLLVRVRDRAPDWSSPIVAFVGRSAPWAVAALTVLWAVAFASIYMREHTRIEASRWIHAHVPAGSTLLSEHWDDRLPLTLPGIGGPERYRHIELAHYELDTPEKRGRLLDALNHGDYVVLASQKLVDSIPRMPHRYPFTVSFYEGLRDGSLGFERVARFERRMRFLWWRISTRGAEEAFSVYDHPPVVIYRKKPAYDAEALVRRFNAIPLEAVTDTRYPVGTDGPVRRAARVSPRASSPELLPESAILLPPERWAAAQREGTWSELFPRDSWANRFPLLAWVGLLLLLQLVGWMCLFGPLRMLPDRGAALARLAGIALPLWAQWLLASLGWVPARAWSWWLLLGLVALGGAWVAWRRRGAWRGFLAAEWRPLAAGEAVFWLGFALCLGIRWANPDTWNAALAGEKPMELAFLHGVMKSDYFPPTNPWYAGGFINYYYFGFVLCGGLIEGLGIVPQTGFNLCLATWFGLAAAAAFGAARALVPSRLKNSATEARTTRREGVLWPAWAAAGFVMVLGNWFQVRFFWLRLVALGREDHELAFPLVSDAIRAAHGLARWLHGARIAPYESDIYWSAARAIVPGTAGEVAPVTEFPFWSFLYADLHPHLIALPFTLGAVALAAAWLRAERTGGRWLLGTLLAFTLGMFWPMNTWDWPTYGAVAGLAFFLAAWHGRDGWGGFAGAAVRSVAAFAAVLGAGRLLFAPFYAHYRPGYGAFDPWTGGQTSLTDAFFVWGFPWFLLGTAMAVAWQLGGGRLLRGMRALLRLLRAMMPGGDERRRMELQSLAARRPGPFVAAGLALGALWLGAMCFLAWRTLPPLLGLGALACLVLVLDRRREPLRALPWVLAMVAFALCLVVELLVLRGDIGRMNTVFKFYYQAWTLFALAATLALPDILAARRAWRPRVRRTWTAALALGLAGGLLFAATATPKKIADRIAPAAPRGMDGLAFTEEAQYALEGPTFSLAGDGRAIRWIQDHVVGSPVLLEMNTGSLLYTWGGRYSWNTGLPTIAGWSWHQRQQQAALQNSLVDARIADVQFLYRTPDAAAARAMMRRYEVGLVVVGELERRFGTPEGCAKFARMGLERLYDSEGVTVWRVPR